MAAALVAGDTVACLVAREKRARCSADVFVYSESASGWKTPVQAAWSDFMLKNVASRDFSVIVLIFAAIGKLDWFLWMAAIGSVVFSIIMLWVIRPSATTRA